MKAKIRSLVVYLFMCTLVVTTVLAMPVSAAENTSLSKTNDKSEINRVGVPGYYWCTANDVNVRSGPGLNYSVVGTLNKGDMILVVSISTGWAKFEQNGYYRYVKDDYIMEVI